MRSPFPGMDPYLEHPAYWPDFHRSFITYSRDALYESLPPSYEARIDEQIRLVEREAEPGRRIAPDITVVHGAGDGVQTSGSAASAAATIEPVTITTPDVEEVRDVWIEILHLPERSLVTVIEVLSPSNKTGKGFGEYWARCGSILSQQVHLVELDLLLAGQRLFTRGLPAGHYYAFVARQEQRHQVAAYAWTVRDPLPAIPIPLKAPDPDLRLDLAGVFATTYERGRYARSLAYADALSAPLGVQDVAWVRERVTTLQNRYH